MAASNLAQTRKFHPRLSMMSQYQSEEAKQWELDEIEGNLYAAGWMQDEFKEMMFSSAPCPWAMPGTVFLRLTPPHTLGVTRHSGTVGYQAHPSSAIPALLSSSSPCSWGSDVDGFHCPACSTIPRGSMAPAPSLLAPPACLLCVLFLFVTYLTHQSCARYAQQLLIPPLQPLVIGSTHWELCFMSAGNSK